jgi:hypothetical protein
MFRCAAPNKGSDYKKIYADWCHEFEKYKSAMKLWEKRQTVSICFDVLRSLHIHLSTMNTKKESSVHRKQEKENIKMFFHDKIL